LSHEIVNPFEPPKTLEATARPAVDVQEEFRAKLRWDSPGKRLAGWFLIANAAVSAVALFAPETRVGFLSILLDVIVGFVLVRGYGSAASVALFRMVFGIFLAVVAAFQGDLDPILFMIPYATGLMLLVIGTPSRVRIVLGCAFFGLYLISFAAIVALLMSSAI
jgi:hypothetical protein